MVMTAVTRLPHTRASSVLRVRSSGPAAAVAAVSSLALVGAAVLGFHNPSYQPADRGAVSVEGPDGIQALQLPAPVVTVTKPATPVRTQQVGGTGASGGSGGSGQNNPVPVAPQPTTTPTTTPATDGSTGNPGPAAPQPTTGTPTSTGTPT